MQKVFQNSSMEHYKSSQNLVTKNIMFWADSSIKISSIKRI